MTEPLKVTHCGRMHLSFLRQIYDKAKLSGLVVFRGSRTQIRMFYLCVLDWKAYPTKLPDSIEKAVFEYFLLPSLCELDETLSEDELQFVQLDEVKVHFSGLDVW